MTETIEARPYAKEIGGDQIDFLASFLVIKPFVGPVCRIGRRFFFTWLAAGNGNGNHLDESVLETQNREMTADPAGFAQTS